MTATMQYARVAITACVFCLLYILIALLPSSLFDLVFCRIPAWLASLYLGATCEGTTLALRSGRLLAVTPACGGSDFFILVCSMIVWYATAPSLQSQVSSFKFQIRRSFVLLCVALVFVNGVNSMRVVLSVWTRLASEALLPERFDAAVHMVCGVMIFLPALLCVWWLCKTKANEVFNERKS